MTVWGFNAEGISIGLSGSGLPSIQLQAVRLHPDFQNGDALGFELTLDQAREIAKTLEALIALAAPGLSQSTGRSN